jgi:hypothetical protein
VGALSTPEIVETLSTSLILKLCLGRSKDVEGFKGRPPR